MINTEQKLYESRIETFIERLKDYLYEDEVPFCFQASRGKPAF